MTSLVNVGGRPPSLTPVVHKQIVKKLCEGNWIITSAQAAGVSQRSVMRWIQRGKGEMPGKDAIEPYLSFARDVEEANSKAEVQLVSDLQRESAWRAKAWLLERGPSRERWAPQVTLTAQLAPAVSILDTLRSRAIAQEEELQPLELPVTVVTKEDSDAESGT